MSGTAPAPQRIVPPLGDQPLIQGDGHPSFPMIQWMQRISAFVGPVQDPTSSGGSSTTNLSLSEQIANLTNVVNQLASEAGGDLTLPSQLAILRQELGSLRSLLTPQPVSPGLAFVPRFVPPPPPGPAFVPPRTGVVTLANGGRLLDGYGAPNGLVFGSIGDEYLQLDGTLAGGVLWIKTVGAATDTGWSAALDVPLNDSGRNLFRNYLLRVQQRGAGAFTTNGYTADQWELALAGSDTDSVTVLTLADADRTAIGDDSALFALQDVVAGSATASSFSTIGQPIEHVRRLANTTVTVSFWAKASAPLNIGVSLQQNFGSGGSPSATVLIAAQTIAATTTWTRYSLTFAVPSVAGKTLGSTLNTSYTEVLFAFSSGATNATALGVGVQSGTFMLWGPQIEINPVASQLEKIDLDLDFHECSRYYQIGTAALYGSSTLGAQFGYYVPFPDLMRGVPTVVIATSAVTNLGALATSNVSQRGFLMSATTSLLGATNFTSTWTASAEL